ncbi:28S ribosomal protein S18b, mitochondrial [Tetranychus urticae]|uniref:Small ribosomal subunit protein mS40 n=1 Tax=Tetranychus urticae TaxID=32264 RepID=T1JQI0_TETUR|nr:28S ribosomal protein S18b, mitochondrial [Tetranychus urticae]
MFGNLIRTKLAPSIDAIVTRNIHTSLIIKGAGQGFPPRKLPEEVDASGAHAYQNIYGNLRRPKAKPRKIPEKDRRVPVSWEVSAKYMLSKTFADTYGEYKIWQMYRRNFRGPMDKVPIHTRESCIGEDGYIQNNNPCPVCRDKYLVLDYRNTLLLKQFIDTFTDQLMDNRRTHLCCAKYEELLTEYVKAKEYGTINFVLPTRKYDYREYYHKNLLKNFEEQQLDTSSDPILKKIELYPDYITEDPAAYTFPNVLPKTIFPEDS